MEGSQTWIKSENGGILKDGGIKNGVSDQIMEGSINGGIEKCEGSFKSGIDAKMEGSKMTHGITNAMDQKWRDQEMVRDQKWTESSNGWILK